MDLRGLIFEMLRVVMHGLGERRADGGRIFLGVFGEPAGLLFQIAGGLIQLACLLRKTFGLLRKTRRLRGRLLHGWRAGVRTGGFG